MNNPFETLNERLSSLEGLILEISNSNKKNKKVHEQDVLFTVQEVAQFLKLSVSTIYALTSKGELPVMKRSKRCYYSKLELLNYLQEGKRQVITASDLDTFREIKNGGSDE